METKRYFVYHKEVAIMGDVVDARSKAEAIRLVRDEGRGERVYFEIDEEKMPTAWEAMEE